MTAVRLLKIRLEDERYQIEHAPRNNTKVLEARPPKSHIVEIPVILPPPNGPSSDLGHVTRRKRLNGFGFIQTIPSPLGKMVYN